MKTFKFVLESLDPEILDRTISKICSAVNADFTLTVLPAGRDSTTKRVHRRGMTVISRDDFHILDQLARLDVPHNVKILGVA